ncbi:MAG: Holliday junction resolvase RuvX [Dehalococcoidales bacterium]|nr:Holliday junction resolvase RuvX [Dehalococcoidales bacterium]
MLGLDIGDSRIGVALSDPLGILASPFAIINRDDDMTAVARIAEIVRSESVGRVIVGLPLNMDGTAGSQAEKTRAFAGELARILGIPVEFRDERLSTISAKGLLREAGKNRRGTRYDAAAAAIILQSYLDENSLRADPMADGDPSQD